MVSVGVAVRVVGGVDLCGWHGTTEVTK